jgi:hypothetical protein
MKVSGQIDTTFDFRSDTPSGKDPDAFSPTLRKYHKLLWSKALPAGIVFDLSDTTPGTYLRHQSVLGEFVLSSDTVVPSFASHKRLAHVVSQVPVELLEQFGTMRYTIGGMLVFPGKCVGRQMTINGARGCNHRIQDRFDHTVECIRRHYLTLSSPLTDTMIRYADFFALFESFNGYVEFFFLQDLVTRDCSAVQFFSPFDDFRTAPLPSSGEAYISYAQQAMEFIEARNRRIQADA